MPPGIHVYVTFPVLLKVAEDELQIEPLEEEEMVTALAVLHDTFTVLTTLLIKVVPFMAEQLIVKTPQQG